MLEGLKIVGLSILAAVCYGIVHDNVTVRICEEYFTVFHPRVPSVTSPTELAFYWGVVATWWMGMGLGVPLALFARLGKWPALRARDLVGPLCTVLMVMGAGSVTMGGVGYMLARSEAIRLFEPWASRIDAGRHAPFQADLWAHNTAYAIGFFGGVGLWGWCVRARRSDGKRQVDV